MHNKKISSTRHRIEPKRYIENDSLFRENLLTLLLLTEKYDEG